MFAHKRGDVPYILGLVFLLSGVIYFFASNWPLMDRPVKLALSLLLVSGCFILSVIYKKSATFLYLSNWWLVASAVSFGAAVALIGQMFNSHADSYTLFLIWLIPVLVFAFLTKYQPFYWMAFLLSELTIWLKIYPTGVWLEYSETEELIIHLLVITGHLLLFYWLHRAGLQKLSLAALAVAQYSALFILNSHSIYQLVEDFTSMSLFYALLHTLYIAFIYVYWRSYMTERAKHPAEMAIHLFAFGIYAVYNGFIIYFSVLGENVFLAGFPLLFVLFVFSIYVLTKLAKTSEHAEEKWKRYTYKLIVGIFSFLGTLIAIFSISSFVILLFSFGANIWIGFLAAGILCLAASWAISKREWAVIRLTLQITGIAFVFLASFIKEDAWIFWVITALFIVLNFLPNIRGRAFYYAAANGAALAAVLYTFSDAGLSTSWLRLTLLVFGLLNAMLFFHLKQHVLRLPAYWLSLAYFLFMTIEEAGQPVIWAVVLHLVTLIYLYIHLAYPKGSARLYRWSTWLALIIFLTWKYYEFIWQLLHKSLALFLVSAICFGLFYFWGRRYTEEARTIQSWNIKLVTAVLLVQLLFIGAVFWQKEQLLQNGELVALELVPIDPRSMLQGDYVELRYAIHAAYQEQQQTGETTEGRLLVELRESNETIVYQEEHVPVYQPVQFHPADQSLKAQEGTVIIQGSGRFGQLDLGIEHFFIPEGSGAEWEEKNIALVRIAENGDAILEMLVEH